MATFWGKILVECPDLSLLKYKWMKRTLYCLRAVCSCIVNTWRRGLVIKLLNTAEYGTTALHYYLAAKNLLEAFIKDQLILLRGLISGFWCLKND